MTRLRTRIIVAIVLVAGLFALSVYKVPTTFKVQADTQVIQIVLGDTHRDLWFFNDVHLYRAYETDAAGQSAKFGGSIRVLPGATVTATRIGTGKLRLTCTAPTDDAVVAEVAPDGEGEAQSVTGRLVIVDADPGAKDGVDHPTVLPYSGKRVTLGAEITDAIGERPTLLLRGSVTLLAHTLVGNLRYEAGEAQLGLADYVNLDQAGDAFGLLIAGRQPDLTTVFRVVAKSLSIYRVGALGESVYASALARIKHDYVVQGIWAGAVFLLGLLLRLGGKPK